MDVPKASFLAVHLHVVSLSMLGPRRHHVSDTGAEELLDAEFWAWNTVLPKPSFILPYSPIRIACTISHNATKTEG